MPVTNAVRRNGTGPSVAPHAVTVRPPAVAEAGTVTLARWGPRTDTVTGIAPGKFTVITSGNVPSSMMLSSVFASGGSTPVSWQLGPPGESMGEPSGATSGGLGNPQATIPSTNATPQPTLLIAIR